MIMVDNLHKEYKRLVRKEGLFSGIRNLFNRDYETVEAVKALSFTINEGELVGYIGPNGAGKSTSIKMLTGILVPTRGQVLVNGIVPYHNRKQNASQIGVVFGQKSHLWWDVPVIESFKLLKHMYNISNRDFNTNLQLFDELLDLNTFINIPVRQLSLGQRMRSDIAAALLHNPKILFLDEPTIGLDVIAKEKLREFIKTINVEKKVTVLLTTHDMKDIEKLCSRMIIIDHGRIIYDGSVEEIRRQYGTTKTIVIEFENAVSDFAVPNAKLVKSTANKKWFQFNRLETSSTDLVSYIGSLYPVTDLSVEDQDIEEIVRMVYRGTDNSFLEASG